MEEIIVPIESSNHTAKFISFTGEQKWECELFGLGRNGIIYRPLDKDVPNFFWRWVQYLIIGNRWKRIK